MLGCREDRERKVGGLLVPVMDLPGRRKVELLPLHPASESHRGKQGAAPATPPGRRRGKDSGVGGAGCGTHWIRTERGQGGHRVGRLRLPSAALGLGAAARNPSAAGEHGRLDLIGRRLDPCAEVLYGGGCTSYTPSRRRKPGGALPPRASR